MNTYIRNLSTEPPGFKRSFKLLSVAISVSILICIVAGLKLTTKYFSNPEGLNYAAPVHIRLPLLDLCGMISDHYCRVRYPILLDRFPGVVLHA